METSTKIIEALEGCVEELMRPSHALETETVVKAKEAIEETRNLRDGLMAALETIAGGHISKANSGPDVMAMAPAVFRSAMWTWSQKIARDAIEKAKEASQ